VAYDESLAARIRDHLGDDPALTEKKMFGGIAFMIAGNMAVGVHGDDLMVRISPEDHDVMLTRPGVSQFDMTGRPMRGWVVVETTLIADDDILAGWIDEGIEFARTLAPK
jgi:hypothetical protein